MIKVKWTYATFSIVDNIFFHSKCIGKFFGPRFNFHNYTIAILLGINYDEPFLGLEDVKVGRQISIMFVQT